VQQGGAVEEGEAMVFHEVVRAKQPNTRNKGSKESFVKNLLLYPGSSVFNYRVYYDNPITD